MSLEPFPLFHYSVFACLFLSTCVLGYLPIRIPRNCIILAFKEVIVPQFHDDSRRLGEGH